MFPGELIPPRPPKPPPKPRWAALSATRESERVLAATSANTPARGLRGCLSSIGSLQPGASDTPPALKVCRDTARNVHRARAWRQKRFAGHSGRQMLEFGFGLT